MLPMTDAYHRPLAHLFDAELRYQNGMAPVCQLDDRGHLAGSGTGRAVGPRLRGTLRWSNFEQVFDDHCRLNVAGMIETDDGAHIRFDSVGFARRVEPAPEATWTVTAAVRFMTQDQRYRWLEPLPAVWAGEFDEPTATARYRAYAPDLSVDA
jgi:hypothetical protein